MQSGSRRSIHGRSLRALNAPTRIDELRQEFRSGGGHWGTAIGVFKHNKIAIFGVNNDRTGFLTHQ
jgi:hypothetical protein